MSQQQHNDTPVDPLRASNKTIADLEETKGASPAYTSAQKGSQALEASNADTSQDEGVEVTPGDGGCPGEQNSISRSGTNLGGPLLSFDEDGPRQELDTSTGRSAEEAEQPRSRSPDAAGSIAAQTAALSLNRGGRNDLANKQRVRSPTPPPPPPKDEKYLNLRDDDTVRSRSPGVVQGQQMVNSAPGTPEVEYNEKYPLEAGDYPAGQEEGTGAVDDTRSEIQSIMEQFDEGMGGAGMQEIMSPRMEIAQPMLGSPVSHPPRKSSLEPLNKVASSSSVVSGFSLDPALQLPPRRSSVQGASSELPAQEKSGDPDRTSSPKHSVSIHQPPPPSPDPEPDLPFDFHRFLGQLRHRTADPVAKFLRSFLLEFEKKQWMVHEQVKIVSDFLEFISKKMAQCEVWRTVSDAEFDNAREGMEKLVMNRLYNQTFSPAIPPPEPAPGGKNRRRGAQPPSGPGRRGQHQEDVERDEVLAQKVRIYGWVKEEHLDIKPVNDKGMKFLKLAQQEILKINSYRAPRDKVICVLNCCKVLFGFLRSSQADQSADSFVPLLIYTVLHANPDHLVSNVQYILRFRNQDKLGGEAGYYISSLMGAVQFIESLDRTSLTISDSDFEKNVEAAVSAIAERQPAEEEQRQRPSTHHKRQLSQPRNGSPHMTTLSEKSTLARPEVTPRNSLEAERSSPRRSASTRNGATAETDRSKDEENAAVAGLLRTIQRPLSTIGRIFSDDSTPHIQPPPHGPGPALTPQPGSTPRLSPAPPAQPQRRSSEDGRASGEVRREMEGGRRAAEQQQQQQRRQQLSAEDSAARQASAEAEEARRIQRQEHRVVVETLAGMFPGLDREVIGDVVRLKEGR
ncbi:hypothetical protein H2201_000295 [Coniosporium apollinis]|uniref:VPS9 domain-containing protein n=2 Tax=Coniosporium TaxID=2810619 RepID=A0ABQ9P982_9PEZI|nr:hypothetical protein H2199_003484 [Cladosporium sp. JES 115]KAJ9669428.1 hypothetical protein H2201_000295 [Coniosporium apollinis]